MQLFCYLVQIIINLYLNFSYSIIIYYNHFKVKLIRIL